MMSQVLLSHFCWNIFWWPVLLAMLSAILFLPCQPMFVKFSRVPDWNPVCLICWCCHIFWPPFLVCITGRFHVPKWIPWLVVFCAISQTDIPRADFDLLWFDVCVHYSVEGLTFPRRIQWNINNVEAKIMLNTKFKLKCKIFRSININGVKLFIACYAN